MVVSSIVQKTIAEILGVDDSTVYNAFKILRGDGLISVTTNTTKVTYTDAIETGRGRKYPNLSELVRPPANFAAPSA